MAQEKKDEGLIGNEQIEDSIQKLKEDFTEENLAVLLMAFRKRIVEKGQLVVAVDALADGASLSLKTANYNGKKWFVAYTSFEEELKGGSGVMSGFLADMAGLFDMVFQGDEVAGVLINPYGNMLSIDRQIIAAIKGE